MKRILALLLVIVFALTLVACDGSDDKKSRKKKDNDKTVSVVDKDKDKVDVLDKTDKPNQGIDFSEQTIIDTEDCVLKITDINAEDMFGYALNISVENKSEDTNYTVTVDDVTVNDVMYYGSLYTEVSAGKKANDSVNLYSSYVEDGELGDFTDILITFTVRETDNYEDDPIAQETVHIYPYGESKAKSYVRKAQSTDETIVDTDDVTIILTGYSEDEYYGYAAHLYIVNKSGKDIYVKTDNDSVNGYMIDSYFGTYVDKNKVAYTYINWYADDLKENSIDKVEELEFDLIVEDNEDWSADDLVNITVTLNP